MSSPLKLPPLQTAILDAATVEQLFADLQSCTRIRSVVPRTGPQASPRSISLSEAQAGLLDHTYRGVQIRYTFEGKDWCDTLVPQPQGLRLVRICDSDIANSVAEEAN